MIKGARRPEGESKHRRGKIPSSKNREIRHAIRIFFFSVNFSNGRSLRRGEHGHFYKINF